MSTPRKPKGQDTGAIRRKLRLAPHLIALEPRMMFDGAAVTSASDTLAPEVVDPKTLLLDRGFDKLVELVINEGLVPALDGRTGTGYSSGSEAEPLQKANYLVEKLQEIAPDTRYIFIDTAVSGYQVLAQEWAGQGTVVLIDSQSNGLDQVRAVLANASNVESIHIVSHGEEGAFFLGTTRIDAASVNAELSAVFADIGARLSPNGDILIYGCDVGIGAAGQELIDAIAAKTGADVAASIDDTGSIQNGGDWTLEAKSGAVEATVLISDQFVGLLQLTNSGTWTIAGQGGSQSVGGITTTIALTDGTGTWTGTTNDTFNPALPTTTWATAIAGQPSMITVFNSVAAGRNGTITINFSEAVTNPIINIDRLGGLNLGTVGSQTTNSATLTLTTAGATLTKLAGVGHLIVTGTTITRQAGVVSTGAESSTNNASGTAAGSVQVNGTFTSLTFNVTAVASDGFEIGVSVNRNPPVVALTGTNLLANGGFESGFTGWTSNVASEVATNEAPYGIPANPEGANFLELEGGVGSPTSTPTYVETMVPTVVGQTYTVYLKAVTRVSSNIGDQFSVLINGTTIDSFTTTNAWETYGVTFTATSTTTTLRLASAGSLGGAQRLPGDGNGTIIDDVRVVANDTLGSFTENGAAVAIATANSLAFDGNGATLSSGTIALTNAQAGDQLLVNGTTTASGTLTGGIAYTIAGNTVTLTGASSEANYAAAIRAITFNSTSENPNTTQRVINVTVNDGAQVSNTAVARINVIAVNDAPSGADKTITLNEDTTVTLTAADFGFSDLLDGNALAAVKLTTVPAAGTFTLNGLAVAAGTTVSVADINSGLLRWTPALNASGIALTAFNFQVQDNGGTANGGVDLDPTPNTITFNVNPVNDPPTITLPATYAGSEDTPLTLTGITLADVDAGTSAVRLTISVPAGSGGLTFAATPFLTIVQNGANSVTIQGQRAAIQNAITSGALVYTPTANLNGAVVATLVLNDRGNTGIDPGLTADATSEQATVTTTINLAPVNDPPVAVNDATLVVNEDTIGTTVSVLGNDTDVDGDTLTVTSATATNGTVTIGAGGLLTFTPNPNYNGPATITYTISDGNGGTSTATVPVTVVAVNDAPTLVSTLPSQVNVDAAAGISVPAAQGFADVDNGALTYSATGLPAGLTINATTGVISGTIDRSASQVSGGNYAVAVTATDAGGLSAVQSFSWTVTNPAPTATNDATLVVNEDTTGTTVNVLANDSDPDGDPLTVTSATANKGIVVINADGSFTYTPNANFNGSDTITYTISDGQGGTATAQIPITVNAVNDAPTAIGSLPSQANVDAAAGINVATASAFGDIDGPALSYSATGLPAGLSINATTGAITGTIDRSASQGGVSGAYNVVVTASDGSLSATQSFSWTVSNPAPTATNDGAITNEDTPIPSINVLGNDIDPDGDPLTVTSASAANGIVSINADGSLNYVPNTNFNGTDTITYTISDGQGGTSTATVTVTVVPVNDAPMAVGSLPPQTNPDATLGVSVPTATAFTDVDNTNLTYSATGLPAGLTINSATGVISGTVDASASQGGSGGVYSVVVTASDGSLNATRGFSWTITNPAPTAANDTATLNEDASILIPVLPNDSDPDGDPLTVISAVTAIGTATVVGNQVQYTPPANFNGTATITYTISDGQGGTSTASITVTVNPVNDAPVATPIAPRNTTDGATISVPVASNFTDVDGDILNFAATGLPLGLTIDPVTGVISGVIDKSASQTNGGVYTATITVSDGQGGTVAQTITFNVTNPPPVATSDTAATPEDSPVTISVLANDSDPDGDPLTVTSASSPNGTVVINPDGTITYTPNAGFNGIDTITYEISDGNGGTSLATVRVAVADVNDIPISSAIANQTNLDSQIINLPVAAAFSDPDGDPLSYTATGLPAGLTIDPSTGVITGTIDHSASQVNGGIYSITVTASDGRGGVVSSTFSWTVTNPSPTATNDAIAIDEDTPVRVPVLANDSDPDGDSLTVTSASAGNGTVTINADGSLLYTPNANFNGEDTIIYQISDGEGGFSTATATVTVRPVNDAPTTVGMPNQNGDDGAAVSISVASAFTDLDGDALTFTATGLPDNLTLDPATGLISGTLAPDTSQGGPYVVTITATDPSGLSVTTSFVYSVQNIPPVAVNDVAATPEDVPVVIAVLTNDNDPEGDSLTVTAASATNGTVVINPNGTITFTPTPDFNGIAVVSYTISDGNGGFATATATITVGAVNDAPTSLAIPNLANLDSQSASVNVGDFFADKDGDILSFAATGLPAGLGIDPATGIISGTIDPNASQPNGGVYSVTVTGRDPGGLSTSQTFTWTITNPAPTASNDVATTNEDTLIAIPVLGNDVDPDGDPLAVTTATALNGTVTIGAGGVLSYTPNANFNGTDTITYVISDGNGGTSTATVVVTVNPVNDNPVAVDDSATTNEDTPLTIGVLTNDSDVDGDTLTVTSATSPNGTVVVNPDGTITFTPAANFNGPTTITYTISDGHGGTATATVNVTVDAVNDAPVANPSSAATAEDTPVTVPVLANDTDIDGDALTVTSATAPNGIVVINPDGTVTYTPNADFNGTDTITYTISDGQGGFSTSSVTVTVTSANDAPTTTPIAPQTSNDSALISLPVAGNFSDLDGDTLTFSATGLPTGLAIDPATGVISGTLDPAASQGGASADGVYSVTITADDGNGGTVTQTLSWTVNNPAPVATNETSATNEDTPVSIAVLANDSDPDGDPLTVVSASAPNGTVVINPDGTLTYTPNANFNGTDTITYIISDGNGGTSTATVTVTINPGNDAPVLDAPLPAESAIDSAPVSFPLAGYFSDLDGDTLSFAATGLPPGLTISPTGVVSGTLTPGASQGGPNGEGIYTVTVTASDGHGGTVSTVFTYTVTNPAPTTANDLVATNEDAPVTISVLANDADPDGDPLTVTSATAANGTVVINPDGTVRYTPNANFNGSDTITYTISDGNGGIATATVLVTVNPVNDAPIVEAPLANAAGVDGAPESIATAGSFSDLDGDTLSFSATGLPAGLSINPATGLISGTLDKGASQINGGIYTVAVTASDGNGGTVTTSFTYSVTNPGPTAANDVATTNEDAPVTIAVLTNDSDPDADSLSVINASAPNGSVVINPDGTVTYTPNANFNGADTITYTISDGNGGTSTATVMVTVNAVNDAPKNDQPLAAQTNADADAVTINVAPSFADLDGDLLTFSATGLPSGLSIDAAGVISGTIDPSASQGGPNGDGIYSVMVIANDGNGGTVSSIFSWSVGNLAPVAQNDSASTAEDTLVNINVLTNDSDPDGDALTITSATAPNGTVVIKPDGTIDYTPNPNFTGTDTITYQISDGEGGVSTATIVVTVGPANDAPLTTGLPNLFDIDNSIVNVPVGPAFSDIEGDALTFSATGLPAGLSINPTTGQIFGQIASNASTIGGGIYAITVTADDGNGGTVSSSFTWTISNTAPSAGDDVATTPEEAPVTFNVLGNDVDPDLDPLSVVSATATHGNVVVNGDGTLTFTPDADFNGTATVTYLVTDGNGGFSTATAVITVTPVNDAPNVTPLPSRSDQDGDVISIDAAAQFSDREGNTLVFGAVGLPSGLTIDSVTGEISGTIDPDASQPNGGAYVVTITADDGNGGISNIYFSWTVTNPGPTAVNDIAATTEDVPVVIPVRANDTDPDGDLLSVTSASAPNGTVAINADGTVTYTPNANFNGSDTITYMISDGNGGTSTATVVVTVGPANDAPTASPLPARSNADSTAITGLNAINVAGNFADLDGDALTFSATGLPLGLTMDAAGVISGTIDPSASQAGPNGDGIYSVTVTADDGQGGTVNAVFSWTVTNPPPVATNDLAATNEDTPVNIPVLANDNDPDSDPLTVTTANAGNGTVTIGAGGVLTYTPNANFNGTDTVTYTISDGNGGTSTATVNVTVGPVNDAPISTPIAPRTSPDSAIVSVPVAANFSDIDNASLAFSATGLPAGLSIDAVTGVISGTIDKAASQINGGIYSVTVTATDAGGLTTSQIFSWSVTNPLPVAINDVAATSEDALVNINVLINDSDPDGDALSVTTASAGNGTVVIRPDGTIDYTPNPNFNGVDTLTYSISDGNGGIATAMVTITVGPLNDPPVAIDDATSTDEDTAVIVPVLSNDTDLDGNPLAVTAATAPNGQVVINPDGKVTYTPNPNFNGTDTITYTISDGQGGFDTATVTVVVRPVNDPPVASNDTASTPEDTPVTVNLLGNDSDADGDPLTVVAATSPDGQVTINPDGTVTFTPNPNFNGTTTVSYTISDGNGGFATATVTMTVGPVNDPPVAVNDNAQTLEDVPVTVAVLTNDSDLDGDPLTITAAVAGHGTVVINPDGTISYTPDPDFNGVDLVTYTISDGKGGLSTATLTIGVGLDNDAPVATPLAAQANRDGDLISFPVAGNFSDVDGDPLAFSATGLPPGLSIDPATGLISGMIDQEASQPNGGVYAVSITVADGKGGQTSTTFAWTVTNPAPVAVNDVASTREDVPVTISPLLNDTDPDGDALAIMTATALNGTIIINPSGTITYTPDPNFNGTDTISYIISDGNGGTATATIAVTVAPVNDPPVATNDNAETAEDAPVTIAVLPNDSDVDGDPLSVVGAIAANGTVVINPDGTITYTPNSNFNGVDTVTYTISDGKGGTSTATVTIGVGLINDAPVSTAIAAQSSLDSAVVTLPLASNFTDPDGDPLTFSAVGLPAGLNIDPTTGLISGTIGVSASQPAGGVYSVTVTAVDGKGGATSQIFSWTVTNPLPVAANDTATTSEDSPVTVAVLANDSDPDGDPLTITAATSPNGAVIINPDGTLKFTPAANFNGPATISYTISDGNGGTATATVTIDVVPVNDLPIARSDSAATNEDTPVVIPVLTNDSDVDGDPLSVTEVSASNGTVTVNPDGTVTYVPNPDFNGTDTITYTISDGHGGTSTTTVSVAVGPVNDAPVALNDTGTTAEDQPATLAVLANDTDVDGDPLSISSASSPNGTVSINADGTISFTPNPNFNGPAVITYTISDGKGGTATATATINVTPINDPPIAQPDVATTAEDTPVRIAPLANDSDADGNPLVISAASAPNGTVVINPDGTITYTPNTNFSGADTITYTVSDGQGGTSTTTITVTVAPVNDPPVARNDVLRMDEETTARIPVLANDTDVDGGDLSVTTASSPNGTVVINADGTVSFTPNPGFTGLATINYTISDGRGGTSSASAAVTVVNTNDSPVDGDEALTTIAGVLNTIPVLANASDPDRDPLSVFSASVDVGSVTINPDGTLTYVAPLEFRGIATIVYVVSDGKGGFDRSVVIINVVEANADMNALVGTAEPAGIPDGWHVERLRELNEESIEVPLIIDQTANEFRSLRSTPILFGHRPLLNAINGMSTLRGATDLTNARGPIGEIVDGFDRIRDIRFGSDRLFDPRFGDFIVKSLTGFSVRQLNTGFDQVMIESVVRDQVVYMEVRDIGAEGDPRIIEYQLRTRDGSAMPEWVKMDPRGLAIIERPVDAETLHLVIRAIRADGKVFEIPVIIQGATGEIQLDERGSQKTSAAEPLSNLLAAASNAANDEAARLAAAFQNQV